MTTYSITIALLLLTVLGSLLLALYVRQQRESREASRYFTGFLVAVALYQLGYTLKLALPELPAKLLAVKLEYLGVVGIAPLWLLVTLSLDCPAPARLTPFRWVLLLAVPVTTLILINTDGWHHFIYLDPHLEQRGPFVLLHYGKGPWYLVQIIYNYLATLLANLVLWRIWLRGDPPFHRQAALLMIGMVISWLGLAAHLAGLHLFDISPNAISLPCSAACYTWALYRYRLFDLVKVSRHALVERMSDVLLLFDHGGRLVDCNPAAHQLLVIDPATELGLSSEAFCRRHPELAAAFSAGGGCLEVAKASGAGSAWELSAMELDDGRGRGIGRLVILHDITRLKQAETELRRLNSTLHQQVEQETEKRLNHERALAQQSKLMAMGEMLGAIAHQWRQPLATLGMNVQWFAALRQKRAPEPADWEEFEESSLRQIRYMSETIDEFRNFYHSDKSRSRFSVRGPINEAVRLVAAQFTGHDINLHIDDSAASAPDVFGVPGELAQVVLNLLANARDAIHDLRRSSGRWDPGVVSLQVAVADGDVVIRVSDSGKGIPPELSRRIYEPNFTTREATGGSGLGLYLSRMIIQDRFNGRLTHESVPGVTTFIVTIPPPEGEDAQEPGPT